MKEELFVRLYDDDDYLLELEEKIAKINRRQWESQVVEGLKKKDRQWTEKNGLVKWKGQIYVPVDRRTQENIIRVHHEWGHYGVDKTVEVITCNYWWPKMMQDMKWYVAGCRTCQTVKPD